MKKNKQKKLRNILIISLIVVIAFVATMYYIVNSSNNYSFSEKKWINEQSNTTVDIDIQADLPVFSLNGEGVFYDYIRALESDTNLTFNILHADSPSTTSMRVKPNLSKNDLLLYKDHYVVVSKNANVIGSINDLKNNTVGVLVTDLSNVSYYLSEYPSITFKTYVTLNDMNAGFSSGDISLAIIPLYQNMNSILEANLNINYHLDGLYSYYTISLVEDNKYLNSIMEKFLNKWESELNSKIGEYFLKLYYDEKNFTEVEKESIVNDDFIVGYIKNIPYEGKINRKFTGINNAYLEAFADLTGATYQYIEYNSIEKLTDALNAKKVDIAFNPYLIKNGNYTTSSNLGDTEYVVLAHKTSTLVVNSLYSLNNSTIEMIANMDLTNIISAKKLFTIKTYKDVNTLLKNVDEDSVIIIEKYVYDYYKDTKLKDFSIRLLNNIKLTNTYLLKNENTAFNKLFNFYLSTLSRQEMEYKGVRDAKKALSTNVISAFLLNNIVYVLIFALVVIIAVYRFTNKLYVSKRIKKEDRMLYLDVMTNLKNRNYLNDNIEYWEQNKVYPQAIVMIDLNRIKELNDKKGHEEGDRQIKAAANVLIKTQRENSEIMRTDGNEFMVYLVGYDENVITSYLHKLNREFKNSLPYVNYGVAIGYSMINDELKTLDDAINEAANMMRENKGVIPGEKQD